MMFLIFMLEYALNIIVCNTDKFSSYRKKFYSLSLDSKLFIY